MSALAIVTKPADQSTDDLALVAAVRAGDDRAYELLFVRYQARIAAYVRGMVRDHGRAEDITQEVFISALRRLRQTDSPIAFKPWIYEIAKNACIDAFRRSRHANEVSFDADEGPGPSMVDRGGAPDAIVDAKLAIDDLCGAFGGLSQTHHDILVMREFEGLTYSEIGERLGLSRAAVESTLFRARRRLTEEYEELVSGERCLRVQRIVDAPAGRAVGVRDQRRMARHIAHCQPCRRYARLSGVDLDVKRAASAATRIAALLPLPTFLRKRFDVDDANQFLGHHSPPMLQWSTKVVAVLDPATVSGWPKAIATAATVAVAGLGAGAAVGERDALKDLVTRAPSIGTAGQAPASQSRDRGRASVRSHMTRSRGAAPAGQRPAGGRRRHGSVQRDRPSAGQDRRADRAPAHGRIARIRAGTRVGRGDTRRGSAEAPRREPAGHVAARRALAARRCGAAGAEHRPGDRAARRSGQGRHRWRRRRRGPPGHRRRGRQRARRSGHARWVDERRRRWQRRGLRRHGDRRWRCGSGQRASLAGARPGARRRAHGLELTDAGGEPDLGSFTDTALYALGAYFADRHPELMDDVVRQAQRIEDTGVKRYATKHDVTLESALQTLITGLAVRYYRAVAGSA